MKHNQSVFKSCHIPIVTVCLNPFGRTRCRNIDEFYPAEGNNRLPQQCDLRGQSVDADDQWIDGGIKM
jgi:hypothetical protein